MGPAWLARRPLVGGLLSAPPAGADVLLHHAGARFAHPAAALLPLADANGETLRSAPDALRTAEGRPLLAGLCATDPTRILERLIDALSTAGFAGLVNMPSVGLLDGMFRASLESAGLGYEREVEAVALCSKRGLTAIALVFTADEARRMAEAGAHAVVVHPGPAGRLDRRKAEELAKAARSLRADLPILAAAEDPLGLDGHFSGLTSL